MKAAAEINAEKIEAIIREVCWEPNPNSDVPRAVGLYTLCARRIVEAFDVLQHQELRNIKDPYKQGVQARARGIPFNRRDVIEEHEEAYSAGWRRAPRP